MKPVPHPTGPLMQPIGAPFQPGTPQLPPPPQFPWSPQSPPPHPSSPQPQCPRPWPPSWAHSDPDATGDSGLAFATPAPRPKTVKPSAPAMVASAKIFISFICNPFHDSWFCTPTSLNFRPLRRPPQRAASVLAGGSKGLSYPLAAPRHPVTGGGGPTFPRAQRQPTRQSNDRITFRNFSGECASAL